MTLREFFSPSSLFKVSVLVGATLFSQPTFAQNYSPRFESTAAHHFFNWHKEALKLGGVKKLPAKDREAWNRYSSFIESAQKSSDLRKTLDTYFKGFNDEAVAWLRSNNIQVKFPDSMDGFSKAVALQSLYENYRKRGSEKYNGPVEIYIYGGESSKQHLALISADAYSRLGYDKPQKLGNSDVFIKAPEGWESYSNEYSSDAKGDFSEYKFKMQDGKEEVIRIPATKVVYPTYRRKISTVSSEEANKDGSRTIRQRTEVSGYELTGFLVKNSDISSKPESKFVVVTQDNELVYRNDLGDLSNARQIYTSSADEAIEAMKKLQEPKKISAAQELFKIQLPGAMQPACPI